MVCDLRYSRHRPVSCRGLNKAAANLNRVNLDGNQASIREVCDAGLLAGAVTVVWQRGEVLQVNEIGYRDVDAGLPMQRDTLFRIASMTKPVTVAAVMSLVDEGKLALKDPITRWAPELADVQVLDDPHGPLDRTHPVKPGHPDRGSADPHQRPGLRILGVRADLAGLYAAAVQPGPGRLADRAGQAAAGASARRAGHLQPLHRSVGRHRFPRRGQAVLPGARRAGAGSGGHARHRILRLPRSPPTRRDHVLARRRITSCGTT